MPIPLTKEEKEKLGLDVDKEFIWDSAGRVQKKGGGIVRRFDMTSEKSAELKKSIRKPDEKAREKAAELLQGELGIIWKNATPTQQHLALKAVTGSSADVKLFLEECRQVGKLSGSGPETERIVQLEMTSECLASMVQAIEIVRDLTRERRKLERERRLAEDNGANKEDSPL